MSAAIIVAIAMIAVSFVGAAVLIWYLVKNDQGATDTPQPPTVDSPANTEPVAGVEDVEVPLPPTVPGPQHDLPEPPGKTTPDTVPALPPATGAWKQARNTFYNSYPAPGSNECLNYNGCTWAGQFAYGGKKTLDWVKSNNIVSFFDKSAGNAGAMKGKQIRLRKNGKEFVATVLDTCGDSDCNGCCSKNAASTGYLVDIERHTCDRELGGTAACSGTIEWQEVGGAAVARRTRSRPRSRSRTAKSRRSKSRPRTTSHSRRSRSRSKSRSRSRKVKV